MSGLDRQIRRTQYRLWLNRWLRLLGWSVCFAATAWLLVWLNDRLFMPGRLPSGWLALGAACIGLLGSVLWLVATREPTLTAATALDEAAGLRERVSTCLVVQDRAGDPFAQAVVADAERVVTGLAPGKVIPVRWSRSLSWGSVMLTAALLSLLLPELDLLGRKKAQAQQGDRLARLASVQATIARPASLIEEIEKRNPDLKADQPSRKSDEDRRAEHDPDVLRRETLKKLDRLQDALKQKAKSERFRSMEEVKKRLQQIGEPSDPKSELRALMSALAENDFEQAQKALQEVQEKLAQRAKDGKLDPQATDQMRKQLDELSKKLEEAAKDKQSQRELQNAGVSEEEAKRMLEALSKMDSQQLEKMAKDLAERLKNKGVTEEQMKQMLEKMQQRQKACEKCQGLGDKMNQAAQALSEGNAQSAESQLSEAGEMLSEMEQLEQALNEVESQMSELNDAREELEQGESGDGQCQHCNGTGFRKDGAPCPHCNGSGTCGAGQGSGTRPRDDSVETSTVNKKSPVKTRKTGSVVGQQFVKGGMLSGKSEVEFYEAARAAEIDATDALNKDRIPRVYRKGVKNYFDRLSDSLRPGGDGKKPASGEEKEPAGGGEDQKPAGHEKQPEGQTEESL